MKKAIVGKKLGMTQIFLQDGRLVPVTVIQAGPCTVVQKKTMEKDGYEAVQFGFDAIPENRVEKLVNKPEAGHFKKAGVAPMRTLREFRLDDSASYEIGQEVKAAIFAEGEKVDISGITKGHGFTGPVKRHNGHIQKMSHGGGPVHRHAGSMGSTSDPSRIFKGHHGAGQMGVDQVTVQNLDVVKVDPELNMIVVRGAIPGPKGGIVYVKNTVKTIVEKKGEAGISNNPQKASARKA